MNKKYLKNTFFLLTGGIITKILGIVIRMLLTRTLGSEMIGLYMLILPTFSLFLSINEASFRKSISKLVSENRFKCKNLLFSILPLSLLINIFLTIILVFSSHFIANNLLHNASLYLPLLSISLVLPFHSLSNIFKGFFFGKEKMFPHVISNITEQIMRIVLIIFLIPKIIPLGKTYTITGVILINMFSELSAAIVLLFFLPKHFIIRKNDFKPQKSYVKNILSISIPSTSSRLLSSITYFLEPIIITHILLDLGYSSNFITQEYGIITAYVMPILLLPSFFISSLSNAIFPRISRNYIEHNFLDIKRKMKSVLKIILFIDISIIIFINLIPSFLLNFFYNTHEGLNYLRILSPIFLLVNLSPFWITILEACGKNKKVMLYNTISNVIEILILWFATYLDISLYSLIISVTVSTLINNILNIREIKKILSENP